MTSSVVQLESKLGELYKGLPNMPEKYRKGLTEFLPWLSLVVGILSLLAAWGIWSFVHWADASINYVNQLSAIYGVAPPVSHDWTLTLWVSLLVLLAEAALYLLAFPALRAKKKMGWDLLFLGALVNIVYGVVVIFTSYGGLGNLISSLIGTAIGLYFLYQVKSYYKEDKASK